MRDGSFLRNAESHVNAHCASAPVKSIDIFLSHSWLADGFWKQVALLICCGSPSTYVVTLMSSMLGALFFTSRIRYDIPFEIVVLILGFASFLLSLSIIPLFKHRNTMVFLDKCCIPQNAIAKSYGISRLADYLRVSNKLLILWSPDYLERLWCVYELAVFLRTHKKEDVILVNMNHLKLCVSLMLLQWFGILIQRLEAYLFGSVKPNMLCGYALALASAFSIGLGAFRCGEDWQKSSFRVKSFSVRRSKCSSLADYNTLKERITAMYGSETRFAEVVRGLWLGEGTETHKPGWLLCRSSLRLMCAPYIILGVAKALRSIVTFDQYYLPMIPLQPAVAVGYSTPGFSEADPPSSPLTGQVNEALLWLGGCIAVSVVSLLLLRRLRITFAVCFAAYSGSTYRTCGYRLFGYRLFGHPLYPGPAGEEQEKEELLHCSKLHSSKPRPRYHYKLFPTQNE
ncbi:hypothetical protein FOZ63_002451 [Perkinsus olseni]|uniref:Uncharacterized protein n=1 Tax=Perkinsus olseni TaxID=32597 RepID=A0A7J6RNJ3_PEROL|nr:hypothetical protein FOZ62_003936 [Perkinsus olseni]KAF4755240.1 hypothetical protein FOZ63_002451 [Perkinsus olseni]